jgi:hypothetical protein
MRKPQMIKKIARLEAEVEELLKTDPQSKEIDEKRDKIKTCKRRLDKLK